MLQLLNPDLIPLFHRKWHFLCIRVSCSTWEKKPILFPVTCLIKPCSVIWSIFKTEILKQHLLSTFSLFQQVSITSESCIKINRGFLHHVFLYTLQSSWNLWTPCLFYILDCWTTLVVWQACLRKQALLLSTHSLK